MRLAILHLSDIHFRDTTNPISSMSRSIVAAIASQSPKPDAMLIAISGDVAFSGRAEEYARAFEFFCALGSEIRELNKDVDLAFAAVPGNHDCDLPESAVAFRKAIIAGIGPTVETNSPDAEILNQLLATQNSYFDFQSRLTLQACTHEQRLCCSKLIVLKGAKKQVNLYNTALLSQREETQTLKVPVAVFDRSIRPLDDTVLNVAILHHTNLWLESNNAVQFRRHIEENADLVLSGHQHLDHSFVKLNLDGRHALYVEGGALQGGSNPIGSEFNIIEIDVPGRKQRVVHFDWKRDAYLPTVRRDWSPVVQNRAFRHEFRPSERFQRFLSDPGAGYTHNRKREITLRDIYVYPDLSVRQTLIKPNTVEVAGEGFHDFLRAAEHVIFEGSGQSGRTALAKITYSDLLDTLGHVPIFLDGRELKHTSQDAFTRTISDAIGAQYSPDLVERFLLLDCAKRVLIVDDWHRARLNSKARAEFLSIANERFGKVFLFSDPIFDVKEFATRSKDQPALLRFQHAAIQQFGYKTRAHLIEKWLTLGREHSYDAQELTREIDQIENVVTTLLGKNTLPKFPFIVLSVLQAYQEKKTATAEAGSYGYVYEVLITTALASTAKSPSDIDKKYTFLAHLAYRMFNAGVETLSRAEIVSTLEEYFRAYGLPVATDSMLQDLVGARVLETQDGNYQFYYNYYLEYFTARFYKDALQNHDVRATALANEISEMAKYLNWERHSRILMFFLYLRNPDLIALLINNSDEIFREYAPATLEKDIEFANALYKERPTLEVPGGNVHENREARNIQRDEMERENESTSEGKKITFSETVDTSEKLEIAAKHLDLLGQILRNFPGSLRADAKLRIARCTYLLGLRIVSVILDLIGTAIAHYRTVLTQSLSENTIEYGRKAIGELTELVDKMFLLLTQLGVLGLIKKVSTSVGSSELDQTYVDVLDNLPDTNALRLVDLSIRLDHFPGFPESQVRALDDRVKANTFTHQILTGLVVDHMTFFEVDYRMRQRIGSLLKFRDSSPRIMGQRPKLLKAPEKKSEK